MAGNIKIATYMNHNIEDHVDPITGEVNATSLAEDACWALEPNLTDVPEKYFEIAETIADRYEIKTGVREGKITHSIGFVINARQSDWF